MKKDNVVVVNLSKSDPKKCWSCATVLLESDDFCSKCLIIQPVRELNYFELLNLAPIFTQDAQLITQQYLELQKKFHPDHFVLKSKREYKLALAHITVINEAYETIKSTLHRAEYLLILRGVKMDDIQPEPMLLMEVMELQELLSLTTSPLDLSSLAAAIAQQRRAIIASFTSNFADNYLHEAAQAVIKLKYLSKLHDETIEKSLNQI
jgi:molecular chaperone HscB